MSKVIRLTETQLTQIIKKSILSELEMMDVSSDSPYYQAKQKEVPVKRADLEMLGHWAMKACEDNMNPDCEKVKEIYRDHHLFM